MDLNALGLLPEDEEEDEVSPTCFCIGNVLTTLFVFCMYLCILGNAVPSFPFIFPDYGSNVIDAKLGKGSKVVSLQRMLLRQELTCARSARSKNTLETFYSIQTVYKQRNQCSRMKQAFRIWSYYIQTEEALLILKGRS
jgi:hypothetical protein